ncbi:MAG: NADH-ubiquinone oxidoreductase-F iron-sulfur binding region domain-containing protein [Phycisphaerales bacterium]
MSTNVRAYRATHAHDEALRSVLPELRRHASAGGGRDAAELEALARTVHLPVSAVRAALSSFTHAEPSHGEVHVCAGTSCMLAGGGAMSRELSARCECRPVYCLGYCDRSPAAMTASGRVVPELTPHRFDDVVADRAVSHPAPPSIRCAASRAIVTARIAHEGFVDGPPPPYEGLAAALRTTPEATIAEILASGERGRGGAAFPTGNKLKLAAQAPGTPKFIVANGDEGDPGSFIDRELMERDPHAILEGMAICAHATGAERGVVFIRSEYPIAADVMERAIRRASEAGLLGDGALGRGRPFHVEVVCGMGSYVCGEETALLSAIEGQRGEVWPRPPYPVSEGLFGKPTVVSNVETLANLPWIMRHGAAAFAAMGTPESRGTKAICLNRGFARPGIVEVDFGISLREVIDRLGGGGADGAELEAVLIGGPMGSIVTPDEWDVPVCFTAMAKRGINLGHGGLVAIPKPADWRAILRHLLTFMRDESCGKCVPCRLGSARAHELATSGISEGTLPEIDRILALMREASLCAFGRETVGPVKTILTKFLDRVVADGTNGAAKEVRR